MNLSLTRHAVERYVERVKPALSHEAAEAELEALLKVAGPPCPDQPAWHLKAIPSSEYVHISDGIVALVKDRMVTSVITRAQEAPEFKAAKKREKQQRKAEKRSQRLRDSRPGRVEREKRRERAAWD